MSVLYHKTAHPSTILLKVKVPVIAEAKIITVVIITAVGVIIDVVIHAEDTVLLLLFLKDLIKDDKVQYVAKNIVVTAKHTRLSFRFLLSL